MFFRVMQLDWVGWLGRIGKAAELEESYWSREKFSAGRVGCNGNEPEWGLLDRTVVNTLGC